MNPSARHGIVLAFKTLIFTALVPGTVTVYLPAWLLSRQAPVRLAHDVWLSLPAGLLMLAGVLGYALCAWDFVVRGQGTPAPLDAPKALVLSGLYRWTRNPMFLSVLLVLLAEALYFRSGILFAYTAAAALALHGLVVRYEEPRLRERYGPAYTDYCRTVPRWGWQRLLPVRLRATTLGEPPQ
ncbi:isoprenylcysteine carboxylmethyltransferase family protein [Methylococcus sp. EFPC2]|uniref:methyltransferase family protein n=1 Tax=Methylococcus sp. EFPC2 TaxID=2812648 RepID=UPI0019680588|nr:isoprenylcysteine carboxylmethyltransferase family protein [Methylococcus sp. EFPC2]QSA98875.1 isoprenylcysteine carboxylmethyltransferase family protein [Methylococcus sp. EFPC2]